ncbi:Elongator subunit elp2 [Rhizophlyctis rosea]|nr:Elongator subunit elp2 [Rhizophlyctis rosea]
MLSLQGHTDWVRTLEIATYTSTHDSTTDSHFRDGDLIVASGSQDRYIRLWRISDASNENGDTKDEGRGVDLVAEMMETLAGAGMEEGGLQLSMKAHLMEISNGDRKQKFTVMFDALLLGHEDWVHTVHWRPATQIVDVGGSLQYHQPMSLLSASADKSLILWHPDPQSGTWVEKARVGEIGGSTLGFYGGLLSPDGTMMMANGYNGAIQLWKTAENDEWTPQVGISGHFASVEQLVWDPTGQFLLTTSLDQTTRLFAPWRRSNPPVSSWHECARPQIHGYDLKCLAFLHKFSFVSGADEKVLRVFEAPATFVTSLKNLTGEDVGEVKGDRPIGANIPALGLSNKAVFEGDMAKESDAHEVRKLSSYTAVASTPTSLSEALIHPPFEQHLLQHTLWPEVEKLYGHGYELVSVGASRGGDYVASSCKAAKAAHAGVRLWSTKTWKEVCPPLAAHTLTVTGIRFSPDDKWILTMGRDRAWAVFEKVIGAGDNDPPYKLKALGEKAHARIVWSGGWTHDGRFFVTGSRDKSIKLWKAGTWECVDTLKFEEGVTAVDLAHADIDGRYAIAVGLENGQIRIFFMSVLPDGKIAWDEPVTIPISDLHNGPVKCVSWRPRHVEVAGGKSTLHLASCELEAEVQTLRESHAQSSALVTSDIQQWVRCLTAPDGDTTFYNAQRCISDIKHKHMMEVVNAVDALPNDQLSRYITQDKTWKFIPKWGIFDLFQPTYECNAMDFIRIGQPSKAGDTGKWLCTDKLDMGKDKKCVIFSLGCNNQFDFEVDIKNLFPHCEIHTFDCTGSWSNPSTTFHPWCMGGKDEKDGQGREYKRMSTIAKELGVETISLLKMDIENFEWPFFLDLANEQPEHRPMQILVEFHAGMPVGGPPKPFDIAPTLFENWEDSWVKPMVKLLRLFDQLGYRIAWQERNRWGEFATEIILIHERAL